MSSDQKHIDELISQRVLRQAELAELGEKILASAKATVVGFIDLSDSTQMKHEKQPEEWLAYVFQFIRRSDQLVRTSGGVVVKRIGDELMFTFPDSVSSESFVGSLSS